MNGSRSPVPSSIYTDSIYTRRSTASSREGTPDYSSSTGPTRPPTLTVPIPQANAGARKPVPTAPADGVLLLAIGGSPDPYLMTHVRTLLSRIPMNEVLILGSQAYENAIKALKIEMYSLAGSMSRELAVQMTLLSSWTGEEVDRAIAAATTRPKAAEKVAGVGDRWGDRVGKASVSSASTSTSSNKKVKSVLCNPGSSSSPSTGTAGVLNVLDMDTKDLEEGWRLSFGFVHAVARRTIPDLEEAVQEQDVSDGFGPCFAVTTGSELPIYSSALSALMSSLESANGKGGLRIGYAEQLLAPEPEPQNQIVTSVLAPTDGWGQDTGAFSPGESPTKLWNMWSMQNEINSFD